MPITEHRHQGKKVLSDVHHVARERFGFEQLRPGQADTIVSVLQGRDTLAVMATGSGKSAIYQIAGLLTNGPTVVISPLIALQKDQSESIQEQDMAPSAVVNSTVRCSDVRQTFRDLRAGGLEYIFLAPEQFNDPETLARVRQSKPSLFVVDEAHCISEWGHHFRPEYLRLGTVVEELGHPIVLALTATATHAVRDEIIARLGMRNPAVIVRGFDRPNIWLGVRSFGSEAKKLEGLLESVEESEKPGIIYVGTRKRAETVTDALVERGQPAVFYHAGMKKLEREAVQQAFMSDAEASANIIVATTAFGMGVDKGSVRFVFHYDISESVDAYYQEIGRAGRDGKPASALLFYRPEDLGLRRFFAGTGRIDAEQVRRVAQTIKGHEQPMTAQYVRQVTALSQAKVTAALRGLEDVGAIESLPNGEVQAKDLHDFEDLVRRAVDLQRRRGLADLFRIEVMRGYAEITDCRRRYLLFYFGEGLDQPCGACDNCKAGRSTAKFATDHPFPVRSWVKHTSFGKGLVVRYEGRHGEDVVVVFQHVGYKTLVVEASRQSGVLTRL